MICDSIPFLDVVFCRTTNLIHCCLNSSGEIVNYIARHGVFFSECALELIAMHYIVVSGMQRGQTIYKLLILVSLTDMFDVVTRMNLYRELVHYVNKFLLEIIHVIYQDGTFRRLIICCPLYAENE